MCPNSLPVEESFRAAPEMGVMFCRRKVWRLHQQLRRDAMCKESSSDLGA